MRRRLLVLGNGWGGMRILRDVDKSKYRVTCVSPRNHFVFTPLLASTAVGTLEFRNACEPVRHVAPSVEFFQAECLSLDLARRVAHCASVFSPEHLMRGYSLTDSPDLLAPLPVDPTAGEDVVDRLSRQTFDVEFDDLVIAVGAESNTFNAPGVEEHALFLKEVTDAQRIRQRIVHNFEIASSRACTTEMARSLLHFVVVGGGPTGVEFAAELSDFLATDLRKAFGDIAKLAQVTILDPTGHILPSFDQKLSAWAMRRFQKRNIDVRRAAVASVGRHSVTLRNGQVVRCGMVVWSTGVRPVPFVRDVRRHGLATYERSGRFKVDRYLRCTPAIVGGEVTDGAAGTPVTATPPLDYVFAIGDCADVEARNTPMTAQSAQQEAIYLTKMFNSTDDFSGPRWEVGAAPLPPPAIEPAAIGAAPAAGASGAAAPADGAAPIGVRLPKERVRDKIMEPWTFRPAGQMAYIGSYRALVQMPEAKTGGLAAWMVWRGAYFTMLVSWRNKFLVPMQWIKTWIFGRDVSYLYDWRKALRKAPAARPQSVPAGGAAATSAGAQTGPAPSAAGVAASAGGAAAALAGDGTGRESADVERAEQRHAAALAAALRREAAGGVR